MRYTQVYHSRSISPALETWIARMPKVELHVHLEGATDAALIFEMARRNQVALPAASLAEWQAFYHFRDFGHFIEVYRSSVACMRTPQDFADMVTRFMAQQAALNISYSEVFFSTSLHLGKMPSRDLLAALAEGMRAGEAASGVRIAFIPDIARELTDPQQLRWDVLDFALQAREMGIGIGLGIGGMEAGYPAGEFREVFAEARRQGLHVVAHAGEGDGASSVRDALDSLSAERIGHGFRLLEDEALVQQVRERQIPVEVSPQSNYCTRVVDWQSPHPIRRMVDAGLLCTVNSDDPLMFSTDLQNEYLTLAAQGFSPEELWQLNLNALGASFLSKAEKAGLREQWDAFQSMPIPNE